MRVSLTQLPVQQPSKVFARAASVQRGREALQAPARQDVVELRGRQQGQRKKTATRDGMLGMLQDQVATLKQRRKELVAQSAQDSDNLGIYKEQIKDLDKQLAGVKEQIAQHMLDQMEKQAEEESKKSGKKGSEKTAEQLEAEQMGALADAHSKIKTTESLMANQTAMEARHSEHAIAERNDAGLSMTDTGTPSSREADMSKLSSGIRATESQAQSVNEAADARAEQAGALGQAKAEAEAADAAAAEKAAAEKAPAEQVEQAAQGQAPEGALSAATAALEETSATAPAQAAAATVAMPVSTATAEQAKARADHPALRVVVRLAPDLRA